MLSDVSIAEPSGFLSERVVVVTRDLREPIFGNYEQRPASTDSVIGSPAEALRSEAIRSAADTVRNRF